MTIAEPSFNDVSPQLNALVINGTAGPLPKGVSVTLQALGTFTDNTQRDQTQLVTWSVSPSGSATISSDGRLTALAPGDITVTAALGSVSTELRLNLTSAQVTA